MARIRSIHPGLFSDPEFAGLSDAAQIFYLGLLTEADDNGVFEWKPATLRIRLRPLKDGPVEPLLSEIEAAEKIASYEIDGRKLGAIRNFRKFQRPKSPKSWHPITTHFRNYVGLSGENGEIHQDEPLTFPTNGESPPQMEEEGGRRKKVKKESPASQGGAAGLFSDGDIPDQTPAAQMLAVFNETAKRAGWPQALKMTAARRRSLGQRLKDCLDMAGWIRAMAMAEASDFLCGRLPAGAGHEDWRCDLDFLLREGKFAKLLEGGYANKGNGAVRSGARPEKQGWNL